MSNEESLEFITNRFGDIEGIDVIEGSKYIPPKEALQFIDHKIVKFRLPDTFSPSTWISNLYSSFIEFRPECSSCGESIEENEHSLYFECFGEITDSCDYHLLYEEINNYYSIEYEWID